ncbi:FAD-dependent monooxygenase [Mesorhizobium sp. M0768]|uniref:FAD-dependent monooxygenase n=1 Tax=Mesorhizobium sp. M0768 TaxID=2956996 RepID=UPI00333AE18E
MARRGVSDASDGAFGGNSGIHDAQNLAWKLAVVIRREPGSALPDSYDTERRPPYSRHPRTSTRAASEMVQRSVKKSAAAGRSGRGITTPSGSAGPTQRLPQSS